MAELLIDVDRLLSRVSELDQTLAETIEKSTRDATSKGFLAASLQIKRLTEDLELKIESAGQKALNPTTNDQSHRRDEKQRFDSSTGLVKLFTICLSGGLLGSILGQTILRIL